MKGLVVLAVMFVAGLSAVALVASIFRRWQPTSQWRSWVTFQVRAAPVPGMDRWSSLRRNDLCQRGESAGPSPPLARADVRRWFYFGM